MPITPEGVITNRESSLVRVIEDLLPDFVKSCRENNDAASFIRMRSRRITRKRNTNCSGWQ